MVDLPAKINIYTPIYCDMSGMLYYKAMLTANTNASLMMNKQIKIERSGNTTIRQDEVSMIIAPYPRLQHQFLQGGRFAIAFFQHADSSSVHFMQL